MQACYCSLVWVTELQNNPWWMKRRMMAWCIVSVKQPVVDFSVLISLLGAEDNSLCAHWECFTSGIPKFINTEPKIKEHSITWGDKCGSFGKGKQTVREQLHMCLLFTLNLQLRVCTGLLWLEVFSFYALISCLPCKFGQILKSVFTYTSVSRLRLHSWKNCEINILIWIGENGCKMATKWTDLP